MAGDGTVATGPRVSHRLATRLWRRGVLSSLSASGSTAVIGATSLPLFGVHLPLSEIVVPLAMIVPTGFCIAMVVGWFVITPRARQAAGWADEGRPPTPHEIEVLAHLPRFSGWTVSGLWLAVVVPMLIWANAWVDGIEWGNGNWFRAAVIMAFSGACAGALAYLLGEQVTRGLLATALPADPERWPRTMRVTRRLLLAWLLVSGMPLVIVGYVVFFLDEQQRLIAGTPLLVGCLLFLIIGYVIFAVSGRSITAPMERLREAMARLSRGELEAQVEAVDGGEIGLLQAGFNEMVEGLRERERLRDAFGRHVGTEVAHRALEGDFASEGLVCRVSAMFVDIVSSTAMTEREDPTAVVDILNAFFDKVVRIVGAEGGFVNKFMGDGALCVFGAPLPLENHAERALRAARQLAGELATFEGVRAVIGIGTGDVVAGNIGAADRYEYTVVGPAVNEASRLCEAAKTTTQIALASERTIRAAGDEAGNWSRGESYQLRGLSAPTVSYSPA